MAVSPESILVTVPESLKTVIQARFCRGRTRGRAEHGVRPLLELAEQGVRPLLELG